MFREYIYIHIYIYMYKHNTHTHTHTHIHDSIRVVTSRPTLSSCSHLLCRALISVNFRAGGGISVRADRRRAARRLIANTHVNWTIARLALIASLIGLRDAVLAILRRTPASRSAAIPRSCALLSSPSPAGYFQNFQNYCTVNLSVPFLIEQRIRGRERTA